MENGVVEHALAFAKPASVRIYPGRFCKNPSGIMSMRIILVSCHRPTSRGRPVRLTFILPVHPVERKGAAYNGRKFDMGMALPRRHSVPPTEQFLFGPDERHDPL